MSKMVFNGATVQNKSATANRWKQVNPVLAKGELGHESDTGKLKCGDGVAAWNDLPYVGGINGLERFHDNPIKFIVEEGIYLYENFVAEGLGNTDLCDESGLTSIIAAARADHADDADQSDWAYEAAKAAALIDTGNSHKITANYSSSVTDGAYPAVWDGYHITASSYDLFKKRLGVDNLDATYARKDEIPKVPDMGEYVKRDEISMPRERFFYPSVERTKENKLYRDDWRLDFEQSHPATPFANIVGAEYYTFKPPQGEVRAETPSEIFKKYDTFVTSVKVREAEAYLLPLDFGREQGEYLGDVWRALLKGCSEDTPLVKKTFIFQFVNTSPGEKKILFEGMNNVKRPIYIEQSWGAIIKAGGITLPEHAKVQVRWDAHIDVKGARVTRLGYIYIYIYIPITQMYS